jgi:hypothetical protein
MIYGRRSRAVSHNVSQDKKEAANRQKSEKDKEPFSVIQYKFTPVIGSRTHAVSSCTRVVSFRLMFHTFYASADSIFRNRYTN